MLLLFQVLNKDDTLDLPKDGGISMLEPTNSSSRMFPDISKSLGSDFNPTSTRLASHYDKIQAYFKTVTDDENEFDNILIEDQPVNPKKIEKWIGGALRESLNKGYIMKEAIEPNKSILKTFGIDRETLRNNELEPENINRLYRALYVYSLGFYELIKEPLARCKEKKNISIAVWKVYSILLQYVCKTEYQTVVAQLTKAYQMDVLKLEEIMARNKSEYEGHKEELLHKIAILDDELDITKESKFYSINI